VPAGKTLEGYLRELVTRVYTKRYGERAANDQELIKRLDYEVDVLEKRVLLVISSRLGLYPFCQRAGIPVGPGRGSAAGSIVLMSWGKLRISSVAVRTDL